MRGGTRPGEVCAYRPGLAALAKALVYPRHCPFCDRVIGFEDCPACAAELTALERPVKRLDQSLHYLGDVDGAASVYPYKGRARAAVLHIKFGGAAWNGEALGLLMAEKLFGCERGRRFGLEYPLENPAAALSWQCIVPVPPSSSARGFNLPTLMARQLSLGLGLPLAENALFRRQGAQHQVGLSRTERIANSAGAFAVRPEAGETVEGRNILLVDDVITTGATVAACTQALLKAGADGVFAVSFCVSEPGEDAPERRPK